MSFHKDSTSNHRIHNWEYPNSTARTSATGFVATDVGKPSKQTDTGKYYILSNYSPVEWQLIGDGDAAEVTSHIGNTSNPHSVTKAQVGLGSADNTADADKPISTATQTALDGKSDEGHAHTQSESHNSADTDLATTSLHHTLGTGANQACSGNDSRLSDSRTPTSHASTHKGDGADAIADATSTVSGLLPFADKVKLDAAASLATVSTLVMRDASGRFRAGDPSDNADVETKGHAASTFLAKAGGTMTGFITLHADASSAMHAVTKQQLDSVAAGSFPKQNVRVATDASLSATTYSALALTASANGALTVDGVTVDNNDRVLIKNGVNVNGAGVSNVYNGIFVVTDKGSAGTPWVLTRAEDFDGSPAGEVKTGVYTWATEGTNLGGWQIFTAGTITVDTDPFEFMEFHPFDVYTGANAISISGTSVSLTIDGGSLSQSGAGVKTVFGTSSDTSCEGNDSRLSNSRQCNNSFDNAGTSRTNLGLGGAATLNVGTGTGTVCAGDDSRLSNSRTPTAHASSHEPLGSDPMTVDAVAGTGSLRTLGTGAQQASAGNHNHSGVYQPAFSTLTIGEGGTGAATAAGARTGLGLDFYTVAGNFIGTPANSATVFLFVADSSFSIPTDATNSQFKCGTNPSSATAFTILKNGSSIGTFSFATNGVATPTVTNTSFAAGDIVKITAPAALNGIADVMWTIKGSY